MPADPGRAVFLSDASQDAEAARRIADALRAVGVEVWFDQNELVGGDSWEREDRRTPRRSRAAHEAGRCFFPFAR